MRLGLFETVGYTRCLPGLEGNEEDLEEHVALTWKQEVANFVEDCWFFGGRKIFVITTVSGKQEAYVREASVDLFSKIMKVVLCIFLAIPVVIGKIILRQTYRFHIIDPNLNLQADAMVRIVRDRLDMNTGLSSEEVDRFFSILNNPKLRERDRNRIIQEQLVKAIPSHPALIALSQTQEHYEAMIRQCKKSGIDVPQETREQGQETYTRCDATRKLYADNPGREGSAQPIGEVSDPESVHTNELIGIINAEIARKSSQEWTGWKMREITVTCREKDADIYPLIGWFTSGLEDEVGDGDDGQAVENHPVWGIQQGGHHAGPDALAGGILAQTLQELKDKEKIAWWRFDSASPDRITIQA